MMDAVLDRLFAHLATHTDPIQAGLVMTIAVCLFQNRYLQRELSESNRRFDDFVRELSRFNRRHRGDDR